MAGTRRTSRRGIARLLMVCAVLAGLFLMHGAPATAAEGCHGAVSASMPSLMPMGESGAAPASPAVGADKAMAHPGSGSAVQAGVPSMAHAAMCVSTPARERAPLPVNALLVLTVLAVVVLAGRAVVRGRASRRGPPPPGGRSLLLHVSIART
ncbi:hypothetical protein [Streptomyces sp. MI02-7b]|uniref:hypothetical protein n=1 Tax=Streptomyces sp. MI02-7b TaxID=462941 RepID=UPI0029A77C4E|nr:hypothetical protein [Streptomyces sp. MI02-7b]MDX3075779.1 hypothetical protein [Streptomyces sp. MI02-7b]